MPSRRPNVGLPAALGAIIFQDLQHGEIYRGFSAFEGFKWDLLGGRISHGFASRWINTGIYSVLREGFTRDSFPGGKLGGLVGTIVLGDWSGVTGIG